MEQRFIQMSHELVAWINGPLAITSIVTNVFYAWCLIFKPCKQRLKQPLKILVGLVVTCSILYSTSLISLYIMENERYNLKIFLASLLIVVFLVHSSMTCSVWLNFFYYIQIVPAQRAFLVWVKKNIRSVIITILIYDGMLFSLNTALELADILFRVRMFTEFNSTWYEYPRNELYILSQVSFIFVTVRMLINLFIMTFSSVSTFQYLYRHIRSVTLSGNISCLRVRNEMRVTITGICQGVLYFFYGIYYLFDKFIFSLCTDFVLSPWITFTITMVYISCTTVNLGFGQAVFRLRVGDIWKKLRVLFDVGMATNDVKGETAQAGDLQTSL